MRKQRGVAGIELLILVPVLVILGFAVYKVYTTNQNGGSNTANEQPVSVGEINNDQELDNVSNQLDNESLDDANSELSSLDSDLNEF